MADQQWNIAGLPKADQQWDTTGLSKTDADVRDPLSALSKATGISAAPEDPQYRYPADAPKGPGRFLSKAYTGSPLNIGAMEDAFKEILRSPLMLPVNVTNNTWEDIKSQTRKAMGHLQNNRPFDAVNEIVMAFPLIGPAVRAGKEQIEKGDTAGGWGAIVGAVSQLAAPAVIARAAPAIASARVKIPALLRNPKPAQEAAVQAGLREGIPVDLGTASGNPVVQAINEGSGYTPGGAAVNLLKQPQVVAAQRSRAADISRNVNPAPISPEQWGTEARSTLTQLRSQAHEAANAAYGILKQEAGASGVTVDITAALARPDLQQIRTRLKNEAAVPGGMMSGPKLRAHLALEELHTASPASIELSVMDGALGDIKAYARDQGGPMKVIVSALEEQVQAATRRAGPKAVEARQRGRAAIKERVKLDGILDTMPGEPVAAFNKFLTAGGTNINALRELVETDGRIGPQLGRAWLEKHLEPVLSEGGFDGAAKFRSNFKRLDPSTKSIIFGNQANVAALDQFSLLAEMMAKVSNKSGTTKMQIAMSGASLSGFAVNPFMGMMTLLTPGVLVTIMKNPRAVTLLTQGMTKMLGPGRSSAPAVAKAAQAAALANIMAARREAGIQEQ